MERKNVPNRDGECKVQRNKQIVYSRVRLSSYTIRCSRLLSSSSSPLSVCRLRRPSPLCSEVGTKQKRFRTPRGSHFECSNNNNHNNNKIQLLPAALHRNRLHIFFPHFSSCSSICLNAMPSRSAIVDSNAGCCILAAHFPGGCTSQRVRTHSHTHKRA